MNKALLALTVLVVAVVAPATASAQLPYIEQEPIYKADQPARTMESLTLTFTKITYPR